MEDLLNYLSQLFQDRGFSYGTTVLHRSAVSTFLNPGAAHFLGYLDLSRKAVTLLAPNSYRWVSDLSILDIGPKFMARAHMS